MTVGDVAPEGFGGNVRHRFRRGKGHGGIALSEAPRGERLLVAGLDGDQEFRCRMIALGLMPGAPLRIVEGGGGRPFLVDMAGGKFMLDSKSAAMIAVRLSHAMRDGGVL